MNSHVETWQIPHICNQVHYFFLVFLLHNDESPSHFPVSLDSQYTLKSCLSIYDIHFIRSVSFFVRRTSELPLVCFSFWDCLMLTTGREINRQELRNQTKPCFDYRRSRDAKSRNLLSPTVQLTDLASPKSQFKYFRLD